MLKIVQAPAEVLSQVAKPVGKIDKKIHILLSEMTQTLITTRDPEGVGLAAPQIGQALRLFIVKEDEKSPVRVFINPEISTQNNPASLDASAEQPELPAVTLGKGGTRKKKKKKDVQLEGCLSLKDIWGVVHRSPVVTISYTDEKGKRHNDEKYDGFFATILQHEYDHLRGILFPRRVLEQKEKLYKSVLDDQGEVVFEEIEL